MTRNSPSFRRLGNAEQAVMDHVWSHGPVSAEDVREALRDRWPMKESTVRTVLRRLEEKGYVRHTVDGRTYIYEAAEPPSTVAARAVRTAPSSDRSAALAGSPCSA